MASPIRGSTLSSLVVFLCVAAAWAQHGPTRVIVSPPHVSAPPVSRVPSYPSYPAPAYHPPMYAPRISTFAPSHGIGVGFHPPIRPIRPFPPVVVVFYPWPVGIAPFWGFNSCWWWGSCNLSIIWNFGAVTVPFTQFQSSAPNLVVVPQYEPPPVYGEASAELPQLYLNDGSILSVTDYWMVGGRLHFKMIEAEGAPPVEHDIPFDQLDVQKTTKVNTARGFKFVLRNEPFEQYVRDHPDTPPVATTPPQE